MWETDFSFDQKKKCFYRMSKRTACISTTIRHLYGHFFRDFSFFVPYSGHPGPRSNEMENLFRGMIVAYVN